jgi:hypothetical protein
MTAKQSRTIDFRDKPVFEQPDLEIMSMDVGCSQFHLMLRHMQRDHGVISDAEMALAEQVMAGTLRCTGINYHAPRYNPFTGEFKMDGLEL